jgi:hypothetical protein
LQPYFNEHSRFFMSSPKNHFRTKADEYRVLAAAMRDGSVRLQFRNMAEHYDRMAELYEEEHQRRSLHWAAVSSAPSAAG